MVKRYKISKVDVKFSETMNKIALERIKRNLEKQKISMRELTRMMQNAESYPVLLRELSTKPRLKKYE